MPTNLSKSARHGPIALVVSVIVSCLSLTGFSVRYRPQERERLDEMSSGTESII